MTLAAGDSGFKERFAREARTVSSLSHPHICTIYELDTQDGVDFLVMEHLEGETLAKRLEQDPLSQDEALRYGSELFYRRGNQIWAAPASLTRNTFEVETQQRLFEVRFVAERTASGSQSYDVHPNGRFIVVQPTEQSSQLHIVVNWFEELEERVPTR